MTDRAPTDAVLIPSSLTEGTDDAKIRAYKVGQVARALAIHRVPKVVVYPDPALRDEPRIAALLEYAEAPPYLRKVLFPRRDELSEAGVLVPLNTAHHKPGRRPRVGEVREGYAAGDQVEIGARRPAKAAGDLGEGRVTVEVIGREDDRYLVAARRGPPPEYWGYRVERADSLEAALRDHEPVVATSRTGDPDPDLGDLDRCAVAFGSPSKGLGEMMRDAGLDPGELPYWFDAVPDQGTASIRTEEALMLSLGPLRKLLVGQSP